MMKNLLRKMGQWSSEITLDVKNKTKKVLLDLKELSSRVSIFSIVFIAALVLTMAYSSYVILASDSDPKAATDVTYTRWVTTAGQYTPSEHGFVEFGTFPQTKVTDTDLIATLEALTKESDDTVTYNGEKYLYEKKTSDSTSGDWYKFEPIKWQILDYDATNKQIEIMTESAIESRSWDTQNGIAVSWDGTNGSTNTDGMKSYPSLRLYLNNYDSTTSYSYDPNINNLSYSALEYTTHDDAKFYEKGFLEKAFTDDERNEIVPDVNETLSNDTATDGYHDGTKQGLMKDGKYIDKVRLLSRYETYDLTNNKTASEKYGFNSSGSSTTFGIKTNRIGFVTDYASLKYGVNKEGGLSPNTNSETTRESINWFTQTRKGATYAALVDYQGKSNSYNNATYCLGIRPVMTLDLSNLLVTSGTGSLDDPYMLNTKPFDPTITTDMLTKWFKTAGQYTPSEHGFVEFGTFPQTKVTDTDLIATLEALTKESDGTVTYNGERYLYEVNYDDSKAWFKFEPIKWQVLDIDAENNQIEIMTESAIECKILDSQTTKNILWDGTNGSTNTDGMKSYPSLRLYLNSYDSTGPYDYPIDCNEIECFSNLKYTTHDDATFRDKGFLEKTFTDLERNLIVPDVNEYLDATQDGSKDKIVDAQGNHDKVRLLSVYEMYNSGDTTYSKYGFAESADAQDLDSNRIAFATDYSQFRNGGIINIITPSYSHSTPNKSYNDRNSITCLVLTRDSAGGIKFIYNYGECMVNNASPLTFFYGIRPVITIDLDMVENVDKTRTGSLDSPYLLKAKLPALYVENEGEDNEVAYYTDKYITSDGVEHLADGDVTVYDISNAEDGSINAYIYSDGMMIFDGEGEIKEYLNYNIPWSAALPKIQKVVGSNNGFKPEGSLAFYFQNAVNLEEFDETNFYTSGVTDMSFMFDSCSSLEDLELGDNFDTSNVESMMGMFSNCSNLASINLGENFDTSSVTVMSFMFSNCLSLTGLDLTNFNTSSVTDMSYMFSFCSRLEDLDLGDNFDTSNVGNKPSSEESMYPIPTDMAYMFSYCSALESLELGDNFDTSNVTDMSNMFSECSSLTSLDLGDNFDTSKVTNMNSMFCNCSALTSLELGENIDTSIVTVMDYMFSGCSSLTELDLSKFTIGSTCDVSGFISGIYYLNEIILPESIDANVTIDFPIIYEERLWKGNDGSGPYTTLPAKSGSLTSVSLVSPIIEVGDKQYNPGEALYAWDISEDGDGGVMAYYFDGETYDGELVIYTTNSDASMIEFDSVSCYGAEKFDESNYMDCLTSSRGYIIPVYTITPWSVLERFETECKIKTITIANKTKISSGRYLFAYLTSLEEIEYLNNLDTSSADDFCDMFIGCKNLKGTLDESTGKCVLDLSGWDTQNVKYMNEMFANCHSLENINFGENFDTSMVENYSEMFVNCINLIELDLSSFDFTLSEDAWDVALWTEDMFAVYKTFKEFIVYCYEKAEYLPDDAGDDFDIDDINLMDDNDSKNELLNYWNTWYHYYKFDGSSKLKTITFKEGKGHDLSDDTDIEAIYPYVMFYGLESLEKIDLSKFSIDDDTYNDLFKGCTSLNEIVLPDVNDTSTIALPSKEHCSWIGYKEDGTTKVGGAFTTLPAKNTTSGLAQIKLEVDILYEDEDRVKYYRDGTSKTGIGAITLDTYDDDNDESTEEVQCVWDLSDDGSMKAYLYSNGLLILDGEGTLKDFKEEYGTEGAKAIIVPWRKYKKLEKLTKVVGSNNGFKPTGSMEKFFDMGSDSANYYTSGVSKDNQQLTCVDFTNIDTSEVESFSRLFYKCEKLESVPGISNLNTSKVTNMSYMFNTCDSIGELDLRYDNSKPNVWNVSKVTTFEHMFASSNNIKLNLKGWTFNQENPVSLERMFNQAHLASLDISGWTNTEYIKKVDNLFNFAVLKFKTLDLRSLQLTNTELTTDNMLKISLSSGSILDTISLPAAIKEGVSITLPSKAHCSWQGYKEDGTTKVGGKITTLPAKNTTSGLAQVKLEEDILYTDGTTKYYKDGTNKTDITLATYDHDNDSTTAEVPCVFDISNAEDGSINAYIYSDGMMIFDGEGEVKDFGYKTPWRESKKINDVTRIVMSNNGFKPEGKIDYYFSPTSYNKKDVALSDTNLPDDDYSSIITIDLNNIDTSKVISAKGLFENASTLHEIKNLDKLNTSQIACFDSMFAYAFCKSDDKTNAQLDLTTFDVSKGTSFNEMFSSCQATKIDMTGWELNQDAADSSITFNRFTYACHATNGFIVSGWENTEKIVPDNMFAYLYSATSLDLSSFKFKSNSDTLFGTGIGLSPYPKSLNTIIVPTNSFVGEIKLYENDKAWFACNENGEKVQTRPLMYMPSRLDANGDGDYKDDGDIYQLKLLDAPLYEGKSPSDDTKTVEYYKTKTSDASITLATYDHDNDSTTAEVSCVFDISNAEDGSINAYIYSDGMMIFDGEGNIKLNHDFGDSSDTYEKLGFLTDDNKDRVKKVVGSVYGFKPTGSLRYFCYSMANLETFDGTNFDFTNVNSFMSMFSKSGVKTVIMKDKICNNVTKTSSMFDGCTSLTSVDFSNSTFTGLTSTSFMFNECKKIESIDLNSFNCTLTDVKYMFEGATNLSSLNLGSNITLNTDDISCMFSGTKLLSVDFGAFKGSQNVIKKLEGATGYSAATVSLKGLDLSGATLANQSGDTDAERETHRLFYCENWNINDNWGQQNTDKIKTIILPSNVPTGDDALCLPNVTGYVWQGYDDEENILVSKKFTTLPKADSTSKLYSIKLVENILYEDEDGVKYKASGTSNPSINLKTYDNDNDNTTPEIQCVWDLSADGKVKAYLYNNGLLILDGEGTLKENVPWKKYNKNVNITKVVGSNNGFKPVGSMASFFNGCKNLTSLDLTNFDTSQVTSMVWMFEDCWSLINLDLTKFNTSSVTKMYGMFSNCVKLNSLNLGSFNTSIVTDMSHMFEGCTVLPLLNLGSFNTSSVTDMNCMFKDCTNLASLTLGENFNSVSANYIDSMFENCSSLTELDLSKFAISSTCKVDKFINDASGLSKIILPASIADSKTIDLPAGDSNHFWRGNDGTGPYTKLLAKNGTLTSVSLVSSLIEVGEGANKKTYNILDAKYSWDISETGNGGVMAYYFNGDKWKDGVTDTLREYDGELVIYTIDSNSKVIEFNDCWYDDEYDTTNYENLLNGQRNFVNYVGDLNDSVKYESPATIVPWSILNTADSDNKIKKIAIANSTKISSGGALFASLEELGEIVSLDKLDTSAVTDMSHMFDECPKLTSLDLSNFVTTNVTTMECMFNGCTGLTTLDVSSFNTSSVKYFGAMFSNCSSLTTLDVSNFVTTSAETLPQMFMGCSKLTSLGLSNFDTGNVYLMNGMFEGCSSLTALTLLNFNTENVEGFENMFKGCSSLTSLDVSNFDTSQAEYMYDMFKNCINLTSLNLSSFTIKSGCNAEDMLAYAGTFDEYLSLKSITRDVFDNHMSDDEKNEIIDEWKAYSGSNDTSGRVITKLNEIILPEDISDGIEIPLPTSDGNVWIGYDTNKKSLNTIYTNLPAKDDTSGRVKVKRMPAIMFTIDGTNYMVSDLLYKWDVSEIGDEENIFAYAFKDASNNVTVIFNDESTSGTHYLMDFYTFMKDKTDTTYISKLNSQSLDDVLKNGVYRKLNQSVTPWSILNMVSEDYKVTSFKFNNAIHVKNSDVLFSGTNASELVINNNLVFELSDSSNHYSHQSMFKYISQPMTVKFTSNIPWLQFDFSTAGYGISAEGDLNTIDFRGITITNYEEQWYGSLEEERLFKIDNTIGKIYLPEHLVGFDNDAYKSRLNFGGDSAIKLYEVYNDNSTLDETDDIFLGYTWYLMDTHNEQFKDNDGNTVYPTYLKHVSHEDSIYFSYLELFNKYMDGSILSYQDRKNDSSSMPSNSWLDYIFSMYQGNEKSCDTQTNWESNNLTGPLKKLFDDSSFNGSYKGDDLRTEFSKYASSGPSDVNINLIDFVYDMFEYIKKERANDSLPDKINYISYQNKYTYDNDTNELGYFKKKCNEFANEYFNKELVNVGTPSVYGDHVKLYVPNKFGDVYKIFCNINDETDTDGKLKFYENDTTPTHDTTLNAYVFDFDLLDVGMYTFKAINKYFIDFDVRPTVKDDGSGNEINNDYTKVFNIGSIDLSDTNTNVVVSEIGTQVLADPPVQITPSITVSYKNNASETKELTLNNDYTVSYGANDAAGTGTVTITGNETTTTGTRTINFTIKDSFVRLKLSDLTLGTYDGVDEANITRYKDGTRSSQTSDITSFNDASNKLHPYIVYNDGTSDYKVYLNYTNAYLSDNTASHNPIYSALENPNTAVKTKRNIYFEGLSVNETDKELYRLYEDDLTTKVTSENGNNKYLLTGVTYFIDNVNPKAISLAPTGVTYGANKPIEIAMVFSEELDLDVFDTKYKNLVSITYKAGSYTGTVYLDNYEFDNTSGEHRTKLIFRGTTPNISEEGKFRITDINFSTTGEKLKDQAGNEFDTSSFTKTIYEDNFKDVLINTEGFVIKISATNESEESLTDKQVIDRDKVIFTIDLNGITLDPDKGYTDETILDAFKLNIKNNIESQTDNNKVVTLGDIFREKDIQLNDKDYPFANVEVLTSKSKYKLTVDLSKLDASGKHFIEKDDIKGYNVKVEIEKGSLETDIQKNVKSSFEVNIKKQMGANSLTIKLEKSVEPGAPGDPDKLIIPLHFDRNKNKLVDDAGNVVKFQNGDKIIIEGDPDTKITYKKDGTEDEVTAKLEIPITLSDGDTKYEEIGAFKDGVSINPNDLFEISISLVKLIISKEGPDGGVVTPLGTFDIDASSIEINVTVNEDFKAEIYEGNTLVKTLTESGKHLVENLKNLIDDLTVKVKFVQDAKPDPTPTPPGGGGGGGSTSSGPIYIVVQEEDLKNTHKAYMNGYKDNTFRPNENMTREEVATIVARLDTEFNEEFNFTSYNDFTDANDKWSKNYIGFCKMKDLVHGYEDGSYRPSNTMTRAELATLVNNFLRVQNADYSSADLESPAFSDVDGRWYEEAVNKLAHLGILNGYEDGTFRGDQPVTRIEVAIVMNKINKRTITGEVPEEYSEKVTSMFKDISPDRWFFKDVVEATINHPKDLF